MSAKLVDEAAQALKETADEMAETPEGVALGLALMRLATVDAELAAKVTSAFSAFAVEHAKRLSVRFFKLGFSAANQRLVKPRPPRQGRPHSRLQ